MARIWPKTVVVEGNLAVHIAALRRALGDGHHGNRYIVTIPGRGYSFATPIKIASTSKSAPARAPAIDRLHNLPVQPTRLIGRAEVVSKLADQLQHTRLLTITGAAGIGKTSVALAVAEQLIGTYEHGIWLIDLAPLSDPLLVPSAVASVLGLESRSENPLPSLVATVSDKRMLLVLDNCGHVIEAAACLANAILRDAPGIRILATSREPMRCRGEQVYRLSPLDSPAPTARLSAADVLRYPAVQLFVERATAAADDFRLGDADAPIVADICRKLDGLPLAIELAAARIGAFGVRGLAKRMDDRFHLLTGGHRTALPRHKTMEATLDWSYSLLTEVQQFVLRGLSVFAGGFTLQAAGAVVADATHSEGEVIDEVTELVAKSLVATGVSGAEPRLRLLETTRLYAWARLAEEDGREILSRRHAEYHRDLLEAAGAAQGETVADGWHTTYVPEIDNLRAALTWAFGPEGDATIAVALAAASAPLWLEMSLLTECRDWMQAAIARLDDAGAVATRQELMLRTALGHALMFTEGMSSGARAALTRASGLAEKLQEPAYHVQALAGLAIFCYRLEDFRGGLALARRAEAIAKSGADPLSVSTTEGVLASTLLFLGDYAQALTYARRVHRRVTPAVRRAHIVHTGYDHSIDAGDVAALALWLQGLVDQAAEVTRETLADAEEGGHAFSLGCALTWCGCPIPLWRGELEAAEQAIVRLKEHTEIHALKSYYACSLGYEGLLAAKRGDFAAAERLLRDCLDRLREPRFENLCTPFISGLAEVLGAAGRLDESLAVADEAGQRSIRNEVLWWMPEVLRVKGDALRGAGQVNTTAAEDQFRQSLELARQQGALSWELRTAMSLARLRQSQGRAREARDLLATVYGRFTEGFETADLQAAKQLLDADPRSR